jgi:hypothetical protein
MSHTSLFNPITSGLVSAPNVSSSLTGIFAYTMAYTSCMRIK